jgi:deazaflavin-dependent oxidoreductase (nitroreductase family)
MDGTCVRRLIQRFVSIPAVTRFFLPFIAQIDLPLLRLTKGHFSPSGFIAGWPVVSLTTTGAKTGQPRTTPVIGIPDGPRVILFATNFGQNKNPAWYYNLKFNSSATISYQGRINVYHAYEADGSEREHYWRMAEATHLGYRQYRQRARRAIPVMVLEPEK